MVCGCWVCGLVYSGQVGNKFETPRGGHQGGIYTPDPGQEHMVTRGSVGCRSIAARRWATAPTDLRTGGRRWMSLRRRSDVTASRRRAGAD